MFIPPAVTDFTTVNKMNTRKHLQEKIAKLLLAQKLAVPASQAPECSPYSSPTAFAANLIHIGGHPLLI